MSLYDGGLYAQNGGAIIEVPNVDYPVFGHLASGFNKLSESVENNITIGVNGYLGWEGLSLQLLHGLLLILVMYAIYLVFSGLLVGLGVAVGVVDFADPDSDGDGQAAKRVSKKRGGKKKKSKPKKKRKHKKKKRRRRRKKKKSGFLGMVSSFLGFEGVPGRAIDLVDHHPNGFEGNAMGSGTAPGHLMNLYDRDPNGFEGNTDSEYDSGDEGFSSFMAARETPYFSEVPNYSLELERRERVARNELANMNRKNMSSNKPLVKWETHWNEWQQNNPMDGFEGNSPEDSLQY